MSRGQILYMACRKRQKRDIYAHFVTLSLCKNSNFLCISTHHIVIWQKYEFHRVYMISNTRFLQDTVKFSCVLLPGSSNKKFEPNKTSIWVPLSPLSYLMKKNLWTQNHLESIRHIVFYFSMTFLEGLVKNCWKKSRLCKVRVPCKVYV